MADNVVDRAVVEIVPDFSKADKAARKMAREGLREVAKEAQRAGDALERDIGRGADAAADALGDVERAAKGAFTEIEKGAERVDGLFRDQNGRLRDAKGRYVALGDEAEEALGGVAASASTATKALAGLGAQGGVPGLLALAAAAAIAAGPVAALGAALADLGGFVVLLPAAIATAQAAILSLKIGFMGFGEAIEAITKGDLKKIDEALKQLSPSARAVAVEFQRLFPTLKQVQRIVQENLFAPLRGDLTALANNLLPSLTKGFSTVAAAFGNLFSELAKFFTAPERLKLINDVFATTANLIRTLTPVVVKLFGALEAATAAILPRFGDIALAVGQAAGRFADWLTEAARSGKLAEFLEDAVATLKELIGLGKSVARLLGAVFGDLDDSGRGFIGTLTDIVDKWTEFFESAEGKDAIEDAKKTVENFGNALMFLSDTFVTIERVGVKVLNFWKGVGSFFGGIGDAISDTFTTVRDTVTEFVGKAIDRIKEFPGKIGAFLSSLPGLFVEWINKAFDDMLFRIGVGVGLVIAAVTKLPGMIVTAVQRLPGLLGEFFTNLWADITSKASTAVDTVVGFIQGLPERLVSAAKSLASTVASFFTNAFEGGKKRAKSAIDSIVDFVRNLPSRLSTFVSDVGGKIADVIKSLLNRAISKINEGIAKVDGLLPGDSLPRIPSLAEGGIIPATPGGRIVRAAEAGEDEAVIPLSKLTDMMNGRGAGVTFAPGAIVVTFEGAVPTQAQAAMVGRSIGEGVAGVLSRRNVRTQIRTI